MTDKGGGTPADGSGPHREASAARTAVVWESLQGTLADFDTAPGDPLQIVDAGGGTGGVAVPLAELGHRVTVVEPSPDSLAALERRAAESGVRVHALQGEIRDLAGLLPGEVAHLVLVHNVLEYVDDPRSALADIAGITRPGGVVSLLATNAVAGALHRALVGHVADAHHVLRDTDGRWGAGDPMPRRFTVEQLVGLTERAGLTDPDIQGVRVFADLLAGRAFETLDADSQTGRQLVELERTASVHPTLAGIATQLHVLARKP